MTQETLIVWTSALAISTLSGFLGMGGGILLMLIFLSILPITDAMILHGIVQFVANTTRAVTHQKNIWWTSVLWYGVGAIVAATSLLFIQWSPEKRLVYLLSGVLPLIQFLPTKRQLFDITSKQSAVACGAIMTIGQVTAGATGPLLDAFFNQYDRSRFGIIATKAATQTIAHASKILYFLTLSAVLDTAGQPRINLGHERTLITALGAAVMAIIGTKFGTIILEKITDTRFARLNRQIIIILCAYSFFQAFQ